MLGSLSFAETVLLGGLAGLTIYLGLPFGRLSKISGRARVGLAMFAVGVLAFLFAEVLVHGFELVEEAVEGYEAGEQGIGESIGLMALFAAGFAAGSAGLAMIERWMRPSSGQPRMSGG